MTLTILSSTESKKSQLAKRIIQLSDSYATDKQFLEICEINNYSLVTDLRKGRVGAPGAEKLAQIVRGTGCSGTWLLTGEGEKYPPDPPESKAAEPGEDYYSKVTQLLRLLEHYEQQEISVQDDEQLERLALQSAQVTAKLLERRQKRRDDQDS